MNPRVKDVSPCPGFRLRIVFTNGETRVFDVSPYLHIGVFRELRDPANFSNVRAVLGTVQWTGGQDLCPDLLYEESTAESPGQ